MTKGVPSIVDMKTSPTTEPLRNLAKYLIGENTHEGEKLDPNQLAKQLVNGFIVEFSDAKSKGISDPSQFPLIIAHAFHPKILGDYNPAQERASNFGLRLAIAIQEKSGELDESQKKMLAEVSRVLSTQIAKGLISTMVKAQSSQYSDTNNSIASTTEQGNDISSNNSRSDGSKSKGSKER